MHTAIGDFLSYLDFLLWLNGDDDVDYIEVIIVGANDDESQRLELTPQDIWRARLGLHSPGTKNLFAVIVHFKDGDAVDITDWVADAVGETIDVRYPQEDEFGDCKNAPAE